MSDVKRIAEAMAARGFIREGTGGGCEAWIRYQMDTDAQGVSSVGQASVWVTRFDDPSVPEEMGEAVSVGYYAGEYADECVMMMTFPSLTAFLDATKVQAETLAYRAAKYGSAE